MPTHRYLSSPIGSGFSFIKANFTQTEAFLPITLPNAVEAKLILLRANGQVVSRETLDLTAGQQQLRIALPQQNSELLYVRLLLDGQVYHRKVVLIR
jgi:predicted  nucleic acid-binding Zn ribbon protein